jgi:hypothetical protein
MYLERRDRAQRRRGYTAVGEHSSQHRDIAACGSIAKGRCLAPTRAIRFVVESAGRKGALDSVSLAATKFRGSPQSSTDRAGRASRSELASTAAEAASLL